MKPAEVFCLTASGGAILPPAVQATVLAKYSRSPLSAREILAELSAEDADKFQEKWVVGYGHNSVAELATIPVCFEGVSIVASKYIESWQRPGFSEKSTRYQSFSRDSFVTPPGAPATMAKFAARFYEAYDRIMPRVVRHVAKIVGDDPEKPKKTTEARAFDNVRYLLPAGTGTSVGAVINLRDVRGMISGLRGHTNSEFRWLGNALNEAAMEVVPALMKHTDPDTFQLPVRSLGDVDPSFDHDSPAPYVSIHRPHLMAPPELEQAAFESAVASRHGMDWGTFSKFMASRPAYSEVPDVFKSVKISFDVMMDYGAFRDLQRHRRCEQYVEPLRPDYGYVVPDDILGTDVEPAYREAMEAVSAYDEDSVIHDPDSSQYMIPLGYLHRSLFQMDLKELYYVVELRTKPQGHISYRRIAYEMFRKAQDRFPPLMQWCRAVRPDSVGVHS